MGSCWGLQLETVALGGTVRCNPVVASSGGEADLGARFQTGFWSAQVCVTLRWREVDSKFRFRDPRSTDGAVRWAGCFDDKRQLLG
jgi:hypothetical protein